MFQLPFLPIPRRQYQTYNLVRIYKDNLVHNYRALQRIAPGKSIGVILKSNAYGHGAVAVGKLCDELQVPYVLVDSVYEALILRGAGIRTPIMVMGFTAPENLQKKKYPFTFVAADRWSFESLVRYQPHAPLHIFINTGMNREGFDMEEIPWLIERMRECPAVAFEGLMSHFADADAQPESELTKKQIACFARAIEQFAAAGIRFNYIHLDASNAVMYDRKDASTFVRAGKSFYGIVDSRSPYYGMFKPAYEFLSTIVSLRTVRKGESIGYGATFMAPEDIRVALLPAGYQEGVERRLSNKGSVAVRGVQCPIVGRVAMNYTTIDVSAVPDVVVGDQAIVYACDPAAPNSIAHVSALCETIPHEIMVRIGHTVRTEFV